jgi:ATP/ADP translocase
MLPPGARIRLRESKQAPYAAYDVIVKKEGEKRGRHVYTLVYSLCKMERMESLIDAVRGHGSTVH